MSLTNNCLFNLYKVINKDGVRTHLENIEAIYQDDIITFEAFDYDDLTQEDTFTLTLKFNERYLDYIKISNDSATLINGLVISKVNETGKQEYNAIVTRASIERLNETDFVDIVKLECRGKNYILQNYVLPSCNAIDAEEYYKFFFSGSFTSCLNYVLDETINKNVITNYYASNEYLLRNGHIRFMIEIDDSSNVDLYRDVSTVGEFIQDIRNKKTIKITSEIIEEDGLYYYMIKIVNSNLVKVYSEEYEQIVMNTPKDTVRQVAYVVDDINRNKLVSRSDLQAFMTEFLTDGSVTSFDTLQQAEYEIKRIDTFDRFSLSVQYKNLEIMKIIDVGDLLEIGQYQYKIKTINESDSYQNGYAFVMEVE